MARERLRLKYGHVWEHGRVPNERMSWIRLSV